MHNPYSPSIVFKHFVLSVMKHTSSFDFIKKNKIFRGFTEYGWTVRVLILLAVVFSFEVFFAGIPSLKSMNESGMAMSSVSDLVDINKSLFYDSGGKYLMLVLLEILIFHCSVKTLNILKGVKKVPVFKDFLAAEKRMIMVVFRSMVLEFITIIISNVILGVLGLTILKPIFKFFIQAYFTGFAFMDNYNEQFGITIKESAALIRRYSGVALGVGAVAFILFKIPLIGAIVAPILGAVTATILMYEFDIMPNQERALPNEFVESNTFVSSN